MYMYMYNYSELKLYILQYMYMYMYVTCVPCSEMEGVKGGEVWGEGRSVRSDHTPTASPAAMAAPMAVISLAMSLISGRVRSGLTSCVFVHYVIPYSIWQCLITHSISTCIYMYIT